MVKSAVKRVYAAGRARPHVYRTAATAGRNGSANPVNTTVGHRNGRCAAPHGRPPRMVTAWHVGCCLSRCGGSGGTLLKAMNRIHEIEKTRPFRERYLVGLRPTILAESVLVGSQGTRCRTGTGSSRTQRSGDWQSGGWRCWAKAATVSPALFDFVLGRVE